MKKKKIVILLYFILMATLLITRFQIGTDYLWHVKMGEYIVNFKHLPNECIYSWLAIANDLMFTLHEWLYEVIVYLCYLINPLIGPFLYYTIFISLFTFLLYKATIKTLLKKNLTLFIPFIVLSTLLLSYFSTPRPHIMSWSILLITIYLCYDLYNNNSKKIYFLPIITILWGNIHGGSSCLSYMIPGLFFVLSLFNLEKGKFINNKLEKKKIIRYFIIIMLNIIALLINPYGIEMILYPYINMFDNTMKTAISEWLPLSLKNIPEIIAYFYIIFNLYIFYRGKQKINLIDILLFLVFTYLTISSKRFLSLLIITSFFTTLKYLDDDNKPFGNVLIITLTLGIIFSTAIQVPNLYKNIRYKEISNSLIKTIKKQKPKRLYNDYDIGGYLIYNEIDVFVDGRADAYSKSNLKDSLDIIYNKNNVNELINKYQFDMFIINNKEKLINFLDNNKDYKLIDKDKNYNIYKRITPY